MSYNGSGVFNINTAGQPVVTGTVISSTAFNALTADLATGLTTALTKDGQTTPTANIPMGGFKITGIAAATTTGDALSYGRAATVSTLTNSALTSGRVPYASTAGLFVDSANMAYDGNTLTLKSDTTVPTVSILSNSATPNLRLGSQGNTAVYWNIGRENVTTGDFLFSTQAGEKIRFDTSGNVGIGITPTNSTNYTTLEISNATNGAIFNLCNGATNKGQVFYDSGGIGVNTLGTARNIRWKAGAISGATDAHMTLDTSGNLLVGTTSALGKLTISGGKTVISSTSGDNGQLQIGNSTSTGEASMCFISGASAFGTTPTSVNGNQYIWGVGAGIYGIGGNSWGIGNTAAGTYLAKIAYNGSSWVFSSDERLKNLDGNIENAVDKVNTLRAVYFTWKNDETKKRKVGLIAQDVLAVLPEAVDKPEQDIKENGDPNYLGLGMSDVVPLLVAAIQEINSRLTALESK
jgi:hypothetical protein